MASSWLLYETNKYTLFALLFIFPPVHYKKPEKIPISSPSFLRKYIDEIQIFRYT